MLRIGMTYDLREEYRAAGYGEEETAEFDSPQTIDALERALAANGVAPVRIGHIRSLAQRLAAGERWDFVFNICEGLSARAARPRCRPCSAGGLWHPLQLLRQPGHGALPA